MKRLKPTHFPRRKITRKALSEIYAALRRHYGPRHWWPAETPFEVIVGAILTQNTAWTNVEKAIDSLKKEKLLSPRALKSVSHSRLAGAIRPAGYFNIKASRIKHFIRYLFNRHDGSLRKMFQTPLSQLRIELLGVNGIGPETADSILLYAGDLPTFVIDAYTRRTFSRHRYLRGGEEYEEIRQIFMRQLPERVPLYNDYHAQLVEVGKEFCRTTPRCDSCPLKPYL